MSYYIPLAIVFTIVSLLLYIIIKYLNKKKYNFSNLLGNKNISIIVAHPDDELMFFFPTIKFLFDKKKKKNIFILSLSNGNYYGYGNIREKELYKVWSYIGGEKNNCHIWNDNKIQDGWLYWDEKYIFKLIKNYCAQYDIKTIFTFDNYGVSGHPNHISTYKSIRMLSNMKDIDIYTLKSTNIIYKYMSFFSYPFITNKRFVLWSFNPLFLLRLMFFYKSQLVYYRILFCIFSQYVYFNTFDLLKTHTNRGF
ncbi:N-acetylglucosaminylphosphatidylinositol deacetylase, putative [Plasmodium sp. gorilla clade G3]|nr:N-acetylglucosaminylphosphatidylinositol deacetylase, putative [Plasmodium sp. gorilla clade G3]